MKTTIGGIIGAAGVCVGLALAPATSAEFERGGDRDCGDFSSQKAAQDFFIANGGPGSDPHALDADHDGVACESNPCPCSTSTGGDNPPPPPPDPTKTEKLCGHILGATGSKVCLKVVTEGDELKKVKYFIFRGLPGKCASGLDPKLRGAARSRIREHGSKFATHRVRVRGNPAQLQARIAGKVKDGKAEGEMRLRFQNGAGAACDTTLRKWKAN